MSSEDPDGQPSPRDLEEAFAARLDQLEEVLRQELGRERRRAERAEAQLRAFAALDEHAEELVAAARSEATRLLAAARLEQERAAAARLEVEDLLAQTRRAAGPPPPSEATPGSSPASTPDPAAGPDRELLLALRDHLIDLGALQAAMTSETRKAVIAIVQASSRERGTPVLRPLPSDAAQKRARK